MTTVGLISIGVLILAVGIGLGFLFGHTLRKRELAKVSDVQDELNQYRRDVSEHFNQTAVHFQSIGRQYRDLYEHMATGAGALCDASVAGRELPFSPGAILPPDVQTDVEAATTADVPPDTETLAEADDEAEIRADSAVGATAELAQEYDRTAEDDATEDKSAEDREAKVDPDVTAEGESAAESIDEKRIYH